MADENVEPLLPAGSGISLGAPPRAWRAIYTSHFLRSWGERAWEFAVGLILLSIKPDTLWFVAAYGLLENLAVILLGPCVGSWLDRQSSQLRGALWSFNCQNLCNVASALIAVMLLSLPPKFDGTYAKDALITAMVIASCAARLASTAAVMSIEKKWVKLLCMEEEDQRMAVVNSAMRRIDLFCLLAAPISSGICMTYLNLTVASAALAAWNAITWAPSILLLRYAGKSLPPIGPCSPGSMVQRSAQDDHAADGVETGPGAPSLASAALNEAHYCPSGGDSGPTNMTPGCMCYRAFIGPARSLCRALGLANIYWSQPVAFPAFALAMLYFTVMSLGLIMTSYLKWKGVQEVEISIFRGCGAIASMSATVSFPPLNQTAGPRLAGVFGGVFQLLCLLGATVMLFLANIDDDADWVPDQHFLLYGMLVCLMFSRWGLWTFDLAVTQQIQESVPEEMLGVFNGMQGSLQSFFELAMSCLTLAIPSPQDFAWLAAASTFTVLLSFGLYSSHMVVSYCQACSRS